MKLYKYPYPFMLYLMFCELVILLLMFIVMFLQGMVSLIFIPFVILWIYSVKVGFYRPIELSESKIVYHGKTYAWEDIQVVACPTYRYQYYLLFVDSEYYRRNIRKEIQKGFYVMLSKKSLKEILKYYDKKIVIIDPNSPIRKMHSSKAINRMIEEHNRTH